ncbi:transcriptional regulator [Microbacterium testaceum StLB037]|uniref:Transcriptional regulator n=1 Tax=Microbacterium testaceum (strain StLB037) TaxID=979556 RepID=E8N703_MICTS|nr:TetR/AcrR family transcriptional regulator [Microbacterium testaceum]BAJ74220.1 transcriptional regulator [Microbacterium testaceum StLB037]
MERPNERPAGRPRTIDPGRVSLVALRLFDERGFDAVSMDEVATAAGVSRRSLFRLFPTKAALVWDGLEESSDRFRTSLAASAEDEPVWEVIRRAFEAGATIPAESIEVTRHRLRVIRANPSIQQVGAPTIGMMTDAAARFAVERSGSSPDDLSILVRVHALMAAVNASLAWWALHGGTEAPQSVVRRALREVAPH